MHQKSMFFVQGQKPQHTVSGLVMEFFANHPYQEFAHETVVDWVTERWMEEHDHAPRDPWRATRKLHQAGILIKVRKGVYKYDPGQVYHRDLWDFPASVRAEILARDNYRCVICGRGTADGVEVVVDHIRPRDRGGTNDKENGQTLCTEHNLLKKNYSQTEAAKRYFVKVYSKALANGDRKMLRFCRAIFDAYDMFGVDNHITRPDSRQKIEHSDSSQHVFLTEQRFF